MVYLNVWLTVHNEADLPGICDALKRAGALSRQEPGCIRWEAHHSQADRKRILLVETWESQASLDAHRKGKAVTEVYMVEVIPKVTREPHVCDLII